MSELSDALDDMNGAFQEAFGDTYSYLDIGAIAAVSFTGIRLTRPADQTESAGAYEALKIRESDFATLPQVGGTVILEQSSYTITAIRNANPFDGTRVLVLSLADRNVNA